MTPGQRRTLRVVAKVLAEQADEEPNRWYAWKKREAARKAVEAPSRSGREADRRPIRR